jgi:hypothetical protein
VTEHDERDDYDDEPWRRRATPEQRLRTPASVIAAFGAIQLGFSILGGIATAIVICWALFDPAAVDAEDMTWYEAVAVLAIVGLMVAWNWLIVRGAARMRNCLNYRLAVLAAVLSFFAAPFYYCIPIYAPVAVWALLILLRRDVRARFEAVARGTMGQKAEVEKPGGSESADPNRGDRPD